MRSKFYVIILILVVLLVASCGSNCKCHTYKINYHKGNITSLVDGNISGLTRVRLIFNEKNSPVIAVSKSWEKLYLYEWNNSGWNKFNIISGVVICDYDFVDLGNNTYLFLISLKQNNNQNGCSVEEITYDTKTQVRKIGTVPQINNAHFVTLKNVNGMIRVGFVQENPLYLYGGFLNGSKWQINLIDKGGNGGIGSGNIYYDPHLIVTQEGDVVYVYYELKKPELKIAMYSSKDANWRYSLVPINTDNIEVSPDFDAFLTPWGGVGVVFRNSVDNQLYYAFETTGWEIGRITDGEYTTGFLPHIIQRGNRIEVVYYNYSINELMIANMLPSFIDEAGLKITPWHEEMLNFPNLKLVFDAERPSYDCEWFGLTYYDDINKELKYYEIER